MVGGAGKLIQRRLENQGGGLEEQVGAGGRQGEVDGDQRGHVEERGGGGGRGGEVLLRLDEVDQGHLGWQQETHLRENIASDLDNIMTIGRIVNEKYIETRFTLKRVKLFQLVVKSTTSELYRDLSALSPLTQSHRQIFSTFFSPLHLPLITEFTFHNFFHSFHCMAIHEDDMCVTAS